MAVTSITELSPAANPPTDRKIVGIVTLIWPFSSSARQCSFLLAERDFRLRHRRGQVRVRFADESAVAVGKQRIGVGDEVQLHLEGSSWIDSEQSIQTPGKSVEADLIFRRSLKLRVKREDGQEQVVEVSGAAQFAFEASSRSIPTSSNAMAFVTPVRSQQADVYQSAAPHAATASSWTYASPAFSKRVRLFQDLSRDSGDSLEPLVALESQSDAVPMEGEKRRSFGREISWRVSDTTPPPVLDERASQSSLIPAVSSSLGHEQSATGNTENDRITQPSTAGRVAALEQSPSLVPRNDQKHWPGNSDDRSRSKPREVPSQRLEVSVEARASGRVPSATSQVAAKPGIHQTTASQDGSQSLALTPWNDEERPKQGLSVPTMLSNTAPAERKSQEKTRVMNKTFQSLFGLPLEQSHGSQPPQDSSARFASSGTSANGRFSTISSENMTVVDVAGEQVHELSFKKMATDESDGLPSKSRSPSDAAPPENQEATVTLACQSRIASGKAEEPHHADGEHRKGERIGSEDPPSARSDLPAVDRDNILVPESPPFGQIPSLSNFEQSENQRPDSSLWREATSQWSPGYNAPQLFQSPMLPDSLEASDNQTLVSDNEAHGGKRQVPYPGRFPRSPSVRGPLSSPRRSKLIRDGAIDGSQIASCISEIAQSLIQDASPEFADTSFAEEDSLGINLQLTQASVNSVDSQQFDMLSKLHEVHSAAATRSPAEMSRAQLETVSDTSFVASQVSRQTEQRDSSNPRDLQESDALDMLHSTHTGVLSGRDAARNPPTDQTHREVESAGMSPESYPMSPRFVPSLQQQKNESLDDGEHDRHRSSILPETNFEASHQQRELYDENEENDSFSARPTSHSQEGDVQYSLELGNQPRGTGLRSDAESSLEETRAAEAASPLDCATRSKSTMQNAKAKDFKQLSRGLTTSRSYFAPLSSLHHSLNPSGQMSFTNTRNDMIAAVVDKTKQPVRAKAGPKDYYTIFKILDPSISALHSLRVEVFRPWKSSLPDALVGDVMLLRDFTVKSRKHQPYLLSVDTSAWCVWKFEDASNDNRPVWAKRGVRRGVREEVTGPPVELGDEERERAKMVRAWWLEVAEKSTRAGADAPGDVSGNGQKERRAA